jgi:hypothetical protein
MLIVELRRSGLWVDDPAVEHHELPAGRPVQ